jgi:hypothetical protein
MLQMPSKQNDKANINGLLPFTELTTEVVKK